MATAIIGALALVFHHLRSDKTSMLMCSQTRAAATCDLDSRQANLPSAVRRALSASALPGGGASVAVDNSFDAHICLRGNGCGGR